jgi:cysteine desulfurase
MAANHETGVIQPVIEVANVVHSLGARLHVDAVQGLGKLDETHWSAADSVAVAAHKIRGPKGIGALAWRPGLAPHPLLLGGAQERGLRPGTQDAIAAHGFGTAIARLRALRTAQVPLGALRDKFEAALVGCATVNGVGAPRLPHVSNVSVNGWRGDELVAALDLVGVRVSSGSACSAGSAEPSPVIEAMLGRERALGSLRVSLGEASTLEELERAISLLFQALARAVPNP